MVDANLKQLSALLAWLVQSERAFGLMADAFEHMAAGDYTPTVSEAERFANTTRQFESQARQFRAVLISGRDAAQ